VPATSRVCMCVACVTHSYEQTVVKCKWLVRCVLWVGFRWSGEERGGRTVFVRCCSCYLVAVPCSMTFWCGAPCWTGPAQGTASWNAYRLPLSLPRHHHQLRSRHPSAPSPWSHSPISIPCRHLDEVAVVLDPLLGVGGVPLWRGATGCSRRSQMQQVVKLL
jgi:hypothetical protein